MTESALLKMANPRTREGKEIGYLLFRRSTADADKVRDRDAHVKRLEERLAVAIGRSVPRELSFSPQPSTESISLEQARAKTAALLATTL